MVMNPDEGIRKFGMGIRLPPPPPLFIREWYFIASTDQITSARLTKTHGFIKTQKR